MGSIKIPKFAQINNLAGSMASIPSNTNIVSPTIDQIKTTTVKPINTPKPLVSGTPKPYQAPVNNQTIAPVKPTANVPVKPTTPVNNIPLKVTFARQSENLAGSTAQLPTITSPKPFVPNTPSTPIQNKLPGIITPQPIQTTMTDPNSFENRNPISKQGAGTSAPMYYSNPIKIPMAPKVEEKKKVRQQVDVGAGAQAGAYYTPPFTFEPVPEKKIETNVAGAGNIQDRVYNKMPPMENPLNLPVSEKDQFNPNLGDKNYDFTNKIQQDYNKQIFGTEDIYQEKIINGVKTYYIAPKIETDIWDTFISNAFNRREITPTESMGAKGNIKSFIAGFGEGTILGANADMNYIPETSLQKLLKAGGTIGGMVLDMAALEAAGLTLDGTKVGNTVSTLLSKVPVVKSSPKMVDIASKYIGNAISLGNTFGAQATLKDIAKGAGIKDLPKTYADNFKQGAILAFAGGGGKALTSLITSNEFAGKLINGLGIMPGYGYISTKIQGGSDEEAIHNALLFGIMEVYGMTKSSKVNETNMKTKEEAIKILDLKPGETTKQAYLRQISANHPDRGGSTEKAQEINGAYQTLEMMGIKDYIEANTSPGFISKVKEIFNRLFTSSDKQEALPEEILKQGQDKFQTTPQETRVPDSKNSITLRGTYDEVLNESNLRYGEGNFEMKATGGGDGKNVYEVYPLIEKPVKGTETKYQTADTTATKPYEGPTKATTKLLDTLKGKTTIASQFIKDFMNRQDVKQGEKDLIAEVLADYPDAKINARDFAKDMESKLFSLTPDVGNNQRGYYNEDGLKDIMEKRQIEDATYDEAIYKLPSKLVEESAGWNAHYRDMADYYGHERYFDTTVDGKHIRYVVEQQSDMIQENEWKKLTKDQLKKNAIESTKADIKEFEKDLADRQAFYDRLVAGKSGGDTALKFVEDTDIKNVKEEIEILKGKVYHTTEDLKKMEAGNFNTKDMVNGRTQSYANIVENKKSISQRIEEKKALITDLQRTVDVDTKAITQIKKDISKGVEAYDVDHQPPEVVTDAFGTASSMNNLEKLLDRADDIVRKHQHNLDNIQRDITDLQEAEASQSRTIKGLESVAKDGMTFFLRNIIQRAINDGMDELRLPTGQSIPFYEGWLKTGEGNGDGVDYDDLDFGNTFELYGEDMTWLGDDMYCRNEDIQFEASKDDRVKDKVDNEIGDMKEEDMYMAKALAENPDGFLDFKKYYVDRAKESYEKKVTELARMEDVAAAYPDSELEKINLDRAKSEVKRGKDYRYEKQKDYNQLKEAVTLINEADAGETNKYSEMLAENNDVPETINEAIQQMEFETNIEQDFRDYKDEELTTQYDNYSNNDIISDYKDQGYGEVFMDKDQLIVLKGRADAMYIDRDYQDESSGKYPAELTYADISDMAASNSSMEMGVIDYYEKILPKYLEKESKRLGLSFEKVRDNAGLIDYIVDLSKGTVNAPVATYQKKSIKPMSDTTTADEALKRFDEFVPELKGIINVEVVKQILTPEGLEAFGKYKDQVVSIIEDPKKNTMPHEVFHAMFDLLLTPEEQAAYLSEVKAEKGFKNFTQAEERLAEETANTKREKTAEKKYSSKIQEFFDRFVKMIKGLFGKKSTIDRIFNELMKRKDNVDHVVKKTNKLIKEQQKFQNLENNTIVYHGTPYKFDEFKGDIGFFTEDENFARNYGDQKSFEGEMDADVEIHTRVLPKGMDIFDSKNPEDMKRIEKYLPDTIYSAGTRGGAELTKKEWLQRAQGIREYKTPKFVMEAEKVGQEFESNDLMYNGTRRITDISSDSVTADKIGRWLEKVGKPISRYGSEFKEKFGDDYYEGAQKAYKYARDNGLELKIDDGSLQFYKDKIYKTETFAKNPTYIDESDTDTYRGDFEGDPRLIEAFKKAGFQGWKTHEKGVETLGIFNPGKLSKTDKFQTKEEEYPGQAEREKLMMESFRQSDPRRAELIKEIDKLNEEEQRIGKVGNKKVGKAYADKQMRAWEKKKESIIEDIQEGYGLDANDAYDMFMELGNASYEEVNRKPIKNIDKKIAKEVRSMVNNRDHGRDKKEMAAYNRAQAILNETTTPSKEFDKNFYENNKLLPKHKKSVWRSAAEFASDILEPISYRLGRISPMIKTRVREFDYNVMTEAANLVEASRTFLDQMGKLRKESPELFNEADLALKNGDIKRLNELGIEIPRDVLDLLQETAVEHGLEVEYRKDYFPRVVENAKGLLDKLRGTDARGYITDAIAARTKDLGRELTIEEKGEVANKLLSGYAVDGIRINVNNLKERSVDVITSELNKFYKDPVDGYVDYISAMTNAIEMKKFFGHEDAEKAIGTFIAEMIEKKQLKPEQEEELTKILKAKFNPDTAGGFVSWLRSFISVTSMGSPISAISQLQDVAFSVYNAGIFKAFRSAGIDVKEDLGIDKISEEYSDQTKIQSLTNRVFDRSGFHRMDKIGKQRLVNSGFLKMVSQAKKDSPELRAKLTKMFGDDKRVQTIINDLKEGKLTRDGKFLLFNLITDFQPITQSEMPYAYLKSGKGRLMYVLKSFTLKQLEAIRREGIDEIKDGIRKYNSDKKHGKSGAEGRKQAIGGFKNLLKLTTLLFVMGITTDEIKDFIMMRKTSNIRALISGNDAELGTRMTENFWKLTGLSKYSIQKAKNESFQNALAAQMFVPLGVVDQAAKDINMILTNDGLDEMEKLKALNIYQSIPLFGKLFYRWFGQPTMTSDHYTFDGLAKKKYYKDIFTGEIIRKKSEKKKSSF